MWLAFRGSVRLRSLRYEGFSVLAGCPVDQRHDEVAMERSQRGGFAGRQRGNARTVERGQPRRRRGFGPRLDGGESGKRPLRHLAKSDEPLPKAARGTWGPGKARQEQLLQCTHE